MGNFTTHFNNIIKTGLQHASCLKCCPIPPQDARKLVDLALMPKILCGGVAVTHSLALLEEAFHKIYFTLLLHLGVNRNITREYIMLPQQYQGLGLSNSNIKVLSAKNTTDPVTLGHGHYDGHHVDASLSTVSDGGGTGR